MNIHDCMWFMLGMIAGVVGSIIVVGLALNHLHKNDHKEHSHGTHDRGLQ